MKLIKTACLGLTVTPGLMATTAATPMCLAQGVTPENLIPSQTPRPTSASPRFRPIGTSLRGLPSTTPAPAALRRETSSRVQQAAYLQFGLPENSNAGLPGGGSPQATPVPTQPQPTVPTFSDGAVTTQPLLPTSPVPMTSPPAAAPLTATPSLTPSPAAPRSLPPNPAPSRVVPGTIGSGDMAPMSQPRLSGGDFSTVYNCPNISAASPYMAGRGYGCGVTPASANVAVPYAPPALQIPAPATMPPVGSLPAALPNASALQSATGAPAGSLVTFGQETFPVQVGQGLWGQPVAYVPGQTVRNWLRYMSF